ncbi:MAG: tetracycline resistance MFS efflux pump [Candidatus Bathyarchaeum sp.]|nr:MAG: tetracycline resistance MFS efflux pump [Candidatus Bathyarchaeum sp.]
MGDRADPQQGTHRRLRVSPSFVIVMTTFIDMIGFGMVIPVLPFHPETVGAGALALGILIGSFSLMQFIFSPILGRISDKVGRRPVILISLFSSVISFILFALANSFPLLLLSRITAGMATESSVAQAYISDITTEKDRAKGMGKVGAAHGAGFIIGPAIGGFLSVYGLSTLGFAAAALTGVNLLFAFFFLPESNGRLGSSIQTSSDGYWRRLGSALTKPLMGAVFVILFIITFAFSAIPVIVPLLGISFFGFGELEMSYFFMYVGVVQIVLQGILIGRLTARWGEENLLVFGSLLMALGMFCMPMYPSVFVFFGSINLISSGIGTLNTVLPSFISKRTPADEQGGMLGIAQSVGSIARIPGPLIAGLIAEFAGLNVAFWVSAVLVLVCFFLGFKLFRAHRSRGQRTGVVGYQPLEM